MAADGRVRVTLPVRYRVILQRHRGSMSDAGFLAWILDNIDRGLLAVGAEPIAKAAPMADVLPMADLVSVGDSPAQEDEFEDVI